jgi:hypothetical protein
LFLPMVEGDSCRIGLEGTGASLLGTGVMDAGGLLKADFESVGTGVCLTVAGVDGAGLGELVDFFWKKPKIDFWLFPDCDADGGGCFFCEGRGVDISLPSTPRTMVAILREMLENSVETFGDLETTVPQRRLANYSGVGTRRVHVALVRMM